MYSRTYKPQLAERVISALNYLSMGAIGFVILVIALLSKNKGVKCFLRYHIFQSMFISMGYFLASIILGAFLNVLSIIPFVNILVLRITFYFNMPLLFGFSFIQLLFYSVLFYLAFTSFQGKFTYIPWVSEIIESNLGRRDS